MQGVIDLCASDIFGPPRMRILTSSRPALYASLLAITRLDARGTVQPSLHSLISPEDAQREMEEMLVQFEVLYPDGVR